MAKRSIIALLVSAFACAILNAEELPLIHQPTLTPQDSGTTNGLISVWPVNPQVVWACGRNGTFTVTTDGGQTWNASVVPGRRNAAVPRCAGVQRQCCLSDVYWSESNRFPHL